MTTASASPRLIRATVERGGKVIIPAFAIGRVEELLYWVKRLEEERRIPVLPVFVDSPMATEALARYTERVRELDPELQPEETDGKAPLGKAAHSDPRSQRQRTRAANVSSVSFAPSASGRSPRHKRASS